MSFGLNISLWQFQLASSHHAEGRKCALEWLGLQLSSSTLPAVERSVFLVPHVCRPLSLLMFYTSFNWSSLIFFSRYHWFVLPFITLQPPPLLSPCVQVPHLSFGCRADGSLLVLHNGSKVSVPLAIHILKTSSLQLSRGFICSSSELIF